MFKTLTGDFITVKSATWYVHKLVEILFPFFFYSCFMLERITAYLKEYLEFKDVHNNVRKWPNLCPIFGLGIL